MTAGWTKDADVVLLARRLWNEGVSTNSIARQCFVTKNAIVGYIHRQDWGQRPSPIRRDVVKSQQPAACLPPGGYTSLPRLESLTDGPVPTARTRPTHAAAASLSHPVAEPFCEPPVQCSTRLVRDPGEPLYRRDGSGCLAVNAVDDGKGGTRFKTCDSPLYSVLKPFCEECAKLFYQKPKKREELYAQDC